MHWKAQFEIFFIVSSLRRKPSPICMLKWLRRSRVQIMCSTSSAYRVQHVLCATWYEGTAQLLNLTELKLNLFEIYFIDWTINDDGGEETGVPRENPWRWASENVTSYSLKIQAPSKTRIRTITLVAGSESRHANRYTTRKVKCIGLLSLKAGLLVFLNCESEVLAGSE